MTEQVKGYEEDYSEKDFWDKLKGYATQAGTEVVERSLQLFYAAQNPNTPTWAKGAIYGALGYFISPLDAIPDVAPVVGFADDLGVLAAALATVAIHIDKSVKEKARSKMDDWFD